MFSCSTGLIGSRSTRAVTSTSPVRVMAATTSRRSPPLSRLSTISLTAIPPSTSVASLWVIIPPYASNRLNQCTLWISVIANFLDWKFTITIRDTSWVQLKFCKIWTVCLYHWVLHHLLLFLPPPPPLSLFLSYTRRPTRHASSGVHRAIDKMCERRPRLSPHRFCSLHPLLPRVLNARLVVVVVATHPTCPRCFEAGGSLRSSLTPDLAHRRHWWWVAVWLLMHISWTPYPFIHMSSKLDISVLTSPPPSQAPPSPSHHRYFFSLSTLWMAASQQGRQTRWRRLSSCGPWWQQQWKMVAWSGAKKLDNNGMDWILQNFSDTQLVSQFF